jgi:hypothetical protein
LVVEEGVGEKRGAGELLGYGRSIGGVDLRVEDGGYLAAFSRVSGGFALFPGTCAVCVCGQYTKACGVVDVL